MASFVFRASVARLPPPELKEGGVSETADAILEEMYSADRLMGTETREPVEMDRITRVLPDQGRELQRLANDARESLEVGLGYGFSAIWMMGGLPEGGTHTAIDPFQRSIFKGVGLHQASRIGGRFTFIEDYSAGALTDLIRQRRKFDLIFIDGNHRFDNALVDFFLCDEILNVGGVVAFDDVWMPSIRTVVSFVTENRRYGPVTQSCNNMVVLRKMAEDDRPWDHFCPFTVARGERSSVLRRAFRKALGRFRIG